MEDEETIAATLRGWRKSHYLTTYELAEKLGVSQGYYSRVEQGRVGLKVARIMHWAKAVGADPIQWACVALRSKLMLEAKESGLSGKIHIKVIKARE